MPSSQSIVRRRALSLCRVRLGLVLCGLLAAVGPLPSAVLAETLKGKVVGVTDGDTIRLLVNGRDLYKVRLGEIDAPESGQPFGRASKKLLSELVFGEIISARVTDVDRFGRSVAIITRGGVNINAEMVKRGGAWAFRRYLSDQRYLLWETQARNSRRGLWQLQPDQIVPPWEWRAAKRGRGTSGGSASSTSVSRYAVPQAPSLRADKGCGQKWKCAEMNSCEEARYQLRVCGLQRLDGDGDGVPCEKICG